MKRVRRANRAAIFALLVAAVWPALALAQAPAVAKAPAPVPPPPATVPYDADLTRLSEIIGSLHFLTQLCERPARSQWRDQMTALLDAEQPDPQRRARFVDAFNRGFESYRSVYRTCTDSARAAMNRDQQAGAALAASMGVRYGRG